MVRLLRQNNLSNKFCDTLPNNFNGYSNRNIWGLVPIPSLSHSALIAVNKLYESVLASLSYVGYKKILQVTNHQRFE